MPVRCVTDVLEFWFGRPGETGWGQPRSEWFGRNSAFDAEIYQTFLPTYLNAAEGRCDDWRQTPEGALALVIVLDQFPRNMFRSDPRAYSTDMVALAVARSAVANGFDKQLPPLQRQFLYLPFEHSENLADQERAVELMKALPDSDKPDSAYDWAYRHFEVIRRFGRFPHRNAVLGRPSTPDELRFLAQPGSSF